MLTISRVIAVDTKENTRSKMRKIVAQNLPQTNASISFNDSYPAMKPTEGNLALLAELDQVSKDLGQGGVKPYDPLKRGAADISFVADFTDGIDGLGTMGDGAHTPQETVNLNIKNTAKIFWLIDPIDGTKEYIAGRDEYTLNAALVINSVPVLGLVLSLIHI